MFFGSKWIFVWNKYIINYFFRSELSDVDGESDSAPALDMDSDALDNDSDALDNDSDVQDNDSASFDTDSDKCLGKRNTHSNNRKG